MEAFVVVERVCGPGAGRVSVFLCRREMSKLG